MRTDKRKYTRRSIAIGIVMSMFFSFFGCTSQPALNTYGDAKFRTSGFWAPYEMTEKAFQLYKDAGLNTFFMGNHSGEWNTAGLTYLGSERTMKSLENCQKTGLDAVLNLGKWYYESIEQCKMSSTPFSDFDLYGEYKDIIKAVHIADEPNRAGMQEYGNDELTADYRSVYSVPYMINLFPTYAQAYQLGAKNYDAYLNTFEETILSDFADHAPFVSVDFYPYRSSVKGLHADWLRCYEKIANLAKKYSAQTHFYIQSAIGSEFVGELSESDIRLQAYIALCFGGSWLSYYCYAMPFSSGKAMYKACMLDNDNNPTDLYYSVKKINAEIQTFASAFLAYDWVKTFGITDFSDGQGSVAIGLISEQLNFSDRRYLSSVKTAGDCVVGCFEREEDEGYMLVNYGVPTETEEIEVLLTLKGKAKYLAVYGGEEAKEMPKIIKANKNICKITLKGGEGKFVVPLKNR